MDEKDLTAIYKNIVEIERKLDLLQKVMDARIDKIKSVILAYLEAGSSISLASVKANLKSV